MKLRSDRKCEPGISGTTSFARYRHSLALPAFSLFILLLAIALIPLLMWTHLTAKASPGEPYFISFNDGSLIYDFDWWDTDELVLYAVNPHGAILWLHKIGTAERRKLISATELEGIIGGIRPWEKITFSLSAHRRYVAFYAPPDGPLEPAMLKVVDLGKKVPFPVSFTKVPRDFVIGAYTWDSTDKYIYVSAREFLSPENDVSLGRLSLETGAFLGLVRKSEVDLIESLSYNPAENALVAVSRSFRGEYPRSQFLLSIDLTSGEVKQIMTAYQFRGVQLTRKGQILSAVMNPRREEGQVFPGFLLNPEFLPIPVSPEDGRRERLISRIMLIDPGTSRAVQSGANPSAVASQPILEIGEVDTSDSMDNHSASPAEGVTILLNDQFRGFDFNPYLSPEGDYILFLRSFYRLPYAVNVKLPDEPSFLFARSLEVGDNGTGARGVSAPSTQGESQEFLVMVGADAYKVSPDERYVCARYQDKTYLNLFELPS